MPRFSPAPSARQRTRTVPGIDEEKVIQGADTNRIPDSKEEKPERHYSLDGLGFWQRFKGAGRRRIGIVESLKAVVLSSCA
jgi:hypothetical protein